MALFESCLEAFVCINPKTPQSRFFKTQNVTLDMISDSNTINRRLLQEFDQVLYDYEINLKPETIDDYFDFSRFKSFFLKQFGGKFGRVLNIERIVFQVKEYDKRTNVLYIKKHTDTIFIEIICN